MASRPRIAVVMPAFQGGGAEAVCCWILQALQDYPVTLFTLTPPDLDALDRFYGTNLSGSGLRVACPLPSFVASRLSSFFSNVAPCHSLRQHLISWFFRRRIKQFDLAISAYNEMDLGGHAIQYVHCAKFVLGGAKLRRLFCYSHSRMLTNTTLTCSRAIARDYQKVYGRPAEVVNPPVAADLDPLPWSEKRSNVLCLGRIVPDKKLVEAIEVIEEVRRRGHEVGLEIWGSAPDHGYLQVLRQMQASRDWVSIVANAGREDYCKALARSRYLLHLRQESYGIVIAEAVHSGVVPFVPAQGGQLEIVGSNPALLFRNSADAPDTIASLVSDSVILEKTRRALAATTRTWSPHVFMARIASIVESRAANHTGREP